MQTDLQGNRKTPDYDYLIVGAGLSGLVTAECLSRKGLSALVIDQRVHLGGNCYDRTDSNGVLYHQYGPHYFRTSYPEVKEYLSQFTEWTAATYLVRVVSGGKLWSFPINLETFEQWLDRPSTEEEFKAHLASLPKLEAINNSRDVIVNQVGEEFYNLFYKDYTRKQWGVPAEALNPEVCKRIPIRTNRDDHYIVGDFQALPADGYTVMMERLWAKTREQHSWTRMELMTSYQQVKARGTTFRHLVYTGPLDEYFDWRLGILPYRSLRFEMEQYGPDQLKSEEHPGFAQPYLQINHANEAAYTRTVEVKHITKQKTDYSTVMREFPQDHKPGENDPYYPIPSEMTRQLAEQYRELAKAEPTTTFLGRMALYRYMNMDEVVRDALLKSDELI